MFLYVNHLFVFQLTAMQEKMRKLVEESTRRKKEKKKNKVKKKTAVAALPNAAALPNSSSTGKPGAHPALTKSNSLVDSVDDSIANVVSEASLHQGANKALNSAHNNMTAAAGANASNVQAKTTKTKGRILLIIFFAWLYVLHHVAGFGILVWIFRFC